MKQLCNCQHLLYFFQHVCMFKAINEYVEGYEVIIQGTKYFKTVQLNKNCVLFPQKQV